MWSISTVPTLRLSHSLNFFSTTAKPPQANPYKSSATAKFRGGGRRSEYEYRNISLSSDDEGEEEIERSSQAVVNPALESSSSSSSDPTVQVKREIVSSDQPRSRKLSGSDVIWALQRATANKYATSSSSSHFSKISKSRSSNNTNTVRIQQQQGGEEDGNDSNAIPFCINDWATRLDELDKRLHSLLLSVDL